MQTNSFLRAVAALTAAVFLAACSPADKPHASIEDPPLVKARLHTVTYQTADTSVIDRRVQAGYTRLPPATNYPGAVRVEAALWKVPEEVAAAPVVLTAPGDGRENVRYLVMAPAAPAGPAVAAESAVVAAFYRKVLGEEVAGLAAGSASAAERIHSKTYLVDDVLAARKNLREAGIPITFDAVAITTAYLGDHKLLGITAPDGVIIELVEAAAQ